MDPFKALTPDELDRQCAAEEENPLCALSSERIPGPCLELFRRAFEDQDDYAWELLYARYQPLIGKWVNGPEDEKAQRIQETFVRFWKSLRTSTFEIRFSSIKGVKSYLYITANSVKLDHGRRTQRDKRLCSLEENWEDCLEDDNGETLKENDFLSYLLKEEQLDPTATEALNHIIQQSLYDYILSQLKDPQEELLFRLSFHEGLPPQKIAARYPQEFENVANVYKIKERLLKRLTSGFSGKKLKENFSENPS